MYVNLYPNKELKKTKKILLWGGIGLLCGGIGALLSELVAQPLIRWDWAAAAALVSTLGAFAIAIGMDWFLLKDTYFSMTPERIRYRLSFFGPERTLFWDAIDSIQASEHRLVFELKDSNQVVMRLGHIQDARVANHVSVSIQLAAVQQNIEVNQVPVHFQKVNS
jgi:hypothetical protein